MVNAEALDTVMTFITDHPDKHYQGLYDCGTAACFAGWAARLYAEEFGIGVDTISHGYRPRYYSDNNPSLSSREVAIKVLGLREEHADILFEAGNTRAMLAMMVKDLKDGTFVPSAAHYRNLIYGPRPDDGHDWTNWGYIRDAQAEENAADTSGTEH